MIVSVVSPAPTGIRRQRRWRWSLRLSTWLHLLAMGLVVAELCFVSVPLPEPVGGPQVIELAAEPLVDPTPPPLAVLPPEEMTAQERITQQAEDLAHLDAISEDPRWAPIIEEQQIPPRETAAGDFVSAQLLREIARAEARSDEENLAQLRQLTGRLNETSSAESVDQLATGLKSLFGGSERATQPTTEPAPGEFEIDSAQLHDVRREKLPNGMFRYVAVLIDAKGRLSETDLPEADGKSAFETFELMKSNPLLERVYRGVVMSLLDNLTNPK